MTSFNPSAMQALRFVERELDHTGAVRLTYALDDAHTFVEEFDLPIEDGAQPDWAAVEPLLDLLHWTAGVSYFKAAAPPEVGCETGAPPPAAAKLLEALYSEGLGEFAFDAKLPALPRPQFPVGEAPASRASGRNGAPPRPPRYLVPVGGGKDSIVALEIVRRSGAEFALFSVRDAKPIARTVEVAGVPRLLVERRLDPHLMELNAAGALNGHVPITAIVSCVAALTAALNGYTAVTLANERSASVGNLEFDGIEVNHQFSKSARAERLLHDALVEAGSSADVFSLLRPASELAIARAFSRLTQYHHAFSSCNRNFRLDPARRGEAWCRDCPKCRFVFLALAPFMDPGPLADIFGGAMLDDPDQYAGFALLTATGGHKPFECVGEEEESLAAISLLAADPRWRDHAVVRRLAAEVLTAQGDDPRRLARALALSDEHAVPDDLLEPARALLAA